MEPAYVLIVLCCVVQQTLGLFNSHVLRLPVPAVCSAPQVVVQHDVVDFWYHCRVVLFTAATIIVYCLLILPLLSCGLYLSVRCRNSSPRGTISWSSGRHVAVVLAHCLSCINYMGRYGKGILVGCGCSRRAVCVSILSSQAFNTFGVHPRLRLACLNSCK